MALFLNFNRRLLFWLCVPIITLVTAIIYFVEYRGVPTAGRLIFYDSFESGITPAWRCNDGSRCPTISDSVARAGEYSAQSIFDLADDRSLYRAELTLSAVPSFDIGETYRVDVSIFVPDDWSDEYGGNKSSGGSIIQFHDRCFDNPSWRMGLPIVIWYSANGWRITVQDATKTLPVHLLEGCKNSIIAAEEVIGYASLEKGIWTDWVFLARFSDKQDGFVKVWKNGKLIAKHRGPNYWPEQAASGMGPYLKVGLYESDYRPENPAAQYMEYAVRKIYIDKIRVFHLSS